MNFNINKISENRFDELINDIDNPSIFQSSKFLRTNLLDQKNKLIYLLVTDDLNKNIAIVVVTIKNYFNLFKIYRINRGPLFFDKENLNLSQREGIISKIFLFASKKQFGLNQTYKEYTDSLNKVWKECIRVLAPDGKLCINIMPLFDKGVKGKNKRRITKLAIDDIIKYYTLYEDLMMFWKKKFNNLIYDVDYDILTIDTKHITKNLINHLNLKWDEKCLSPENNKRSVSTASNIQIRNKIFKGSSEKWKKYKPFLNGAFNIFN